MNIVFAEPFMLPAILAIENASFTMPWSEKSFAEALESDNIKVLAALDGDGNVAGFGCLMTLDEEGEILNIAVHPSVRKAGIGQKLLDAMILLGLGMGVRDFYLEVRESNVPARSLYEKNGFIPLGRRKRYYSKPVEDAIVMKKSIEAF